VHTCDFDDETALTPGDGFPVCELDTAAGPVQVGAMICFDLQFPESARVLMLHGAEIVLVPNACEMNDIEGAEVDPLIVRADGGEGVYLARFDLERIRRFREVETQDAAYRKPRAYDGLLDTPVRPPFTRPDAR
jgi:predicted amidohydrolase